MNDFSTDDYELLYSITLEALENASWGVSQKWAMQSLAWALSEKARRITRKNMCKVGRVVPKKYPTTLWEKLTTQAGKHDRS